MLTFINIINILINYWKNIGALFLFPIDLEVGAATSHIYTFFKSLSCNNWFSVYLQSCKRSQDVFFIKELNYLQKYYQLQVIIKPIPKKIILIFLNSLKKIIFNFYKFDIIFIEDNWENPTIGALGFGWEIWINNIEINQFTFFSKMGGIKCLYLSSEITYGLERLCMIIQKKRLFKIIWDKNINYGDIYLYNEIENFNYNIYNFDINFLFNMFNIIEFEVKNLLKFNLILLSYEFLLKLCYIFNLLESKNVFSLFLKKEYIKRLRFLSCLIAKSYLNKIHFYV